MNNAAPTTKRGIGTSANRRQLPIEHEQHDHDPDQRQPGRNDFFEPVDEDALHVLGIVQHPRHDLARRTILIETDR